MITLQNLGDSILFTFDENDKYLNNGTISVPMNSLILVTDDSDMATFRKSATNDIFVSALYSDFGMTKAELEQWYAENMVSEVTEEDVDEKIAEAVGEETDRAVSAETALSGAIDAVDAAYKAADSVISGAVDNLSSALQNESQRAISAETALSGAIDTKIDESAITSAVTSASTDSEIPTAKAVYDALQESGLDEDTEKLISGSLNDLNERKLDASAYTPTDLTNYYTKSETSGATEISTALNTKQDTLIAGDNITISGNVISAEGGGSITIDPTLDSGSTNAVANSAITSALNDTVKLSNVSTYYIEKFDSNDAKLTTSFHRFDVNNVAKGYSLWYGKINNQYVCKYAGSNSQPSGLMDLSLVETSAITTAVTSGSTDSQIPSAKAVNDKLGGLSIVKLTQAEYDALENKDANTLYIVVDEPTPSFDGKWKATYQDEHVTSAECGSSSEINQYEIDLTNLVSLEIGDCVTSIGAGAFYGCTSLTSCTISNGVTSIGNQAFYRCTKLTSIEFPSSVTSIGVQAFCDCSGLTSVTVNATTPPTLGSGAFIGTNCRIYVPSASVEEYKREWSAYASRIQAIS